MTQTMPKGEACNGSFVGVRRSFNAVSMDAVGQEKHTSPTFVVIITLNGAISPVPSK